MSLQKKIQERRLKRGYRTRNKLTSRGSKLRVSIFKSLSHIYAQIIDDASGITLASSSSLHVNDKKHDKKGIARLVGKQLGEVAVQQGLNNVFFDRGRFSYHGRVQELAEGLREAGLKF